MSTHKFTLSEDALPIFKLLTSTLYSNAPLAVAREIVSNAIDTSLLTKAERVDITFPDFIVNYELKVRDYGEGMSPETIKEIYFSLGASTKEDDATQIGKFGIGALAPLAVNDSFWLTTHWEGTKYTYSVYLDSKGAHTLSLLDISSSDESGTEVGVLMPQEACEEVFNYLQLYALTSPVRLNFVNSQEANDRVSKLLDSKLQLKGDNVTLEVFTRGSLDTVNRMRVLAIKGVPYCKSGKYKQFLDCNLIYVTHLPNPLPDGIRLAANRESININASETELYSEGIVLLKSWVVRYLDLWVSDPNSHEWDGHGMNPIYTQVPVDLIDRYLYSDLILSNYRDIPSCLIPYGDFKFKYPSEQVSLSDLLQNLIVGDKFKSHKKNIYYVTAEGAISAYYTYPKGFFNAPLYLGTLKISQVLELDLEHYEFTYLNINDFFYSEDWENLAIAKYVVKFLDTPKVKKPRRSISIPKGSVKQVKLEDYRGDLPTHELSGSLFDPLKSGVKWEDLPEKALYGVNELSTRNAVVAHFCNLPTYIVTESGNERLKEIRPYWVSHPAIYAQDFITENLQADEDLVKNAYVYQCKLNFYPYRLELNKEYWQLSLLKSLSKYLQPTDEYKAQLLNLVINYSPLVYYWKEIYGDSSPPESDILTLNTLPDLSPLVYLFGERVNELVLLPPTLNSRSGFVDDMTISFDQYIAWKFN